MAKRDPALPDLRPHLASAGVFLVLRRMRIPLIVIIVIFAVSVLGLTLVPGTDAEGRPARLSIFEAFYVMSYTATTIGFGEIPYAFTPLQRMWVTFAIFASVIGWAYAIGSLLALTQDKAFRQALAQRGFVRSVARMAEPFLLVVGYGNAAKLLGHSLDDMGRRFVVLDQDDDPLAQGVEGAGELLAGLPVAREQQEVLAQAAHLALEVLQRQRRPEGAVL